jgi:D-alanyl-D-alanine carboxypeptidase
MPRPMLVASLLLSFGGAAPSAALAQPRSLETTVRDHARAHDFSGTVLVEHRGRTILRESFGLADRAFGVPVAADTRFRIASITKLFTAVLVLQLRDEGKLDLRAPIRRYLPGYAGEGADRVTVHHLLNHTSGIENFDQVASYEEAVAKGIEVYQLPHTPEALLRDHASGKLVHEPGTAFDYNNADYIVLGAIAESVSGATYDELLARRILDPLRMTATGVAYQREVVPRLAPTYMRVEEGKPPINDLPAYSQNWWAAGAMYSSADDLLAFSRALFGGRLLSAESLRLMLTPGLDDYGYGLWVPTVEVGGARHRVAQRPGRIMGANVVLLRYLDDDLTVIVLGNTNTTDIDAFAYLIGGVALR